MAETARRPDPVVVNLDGAILHGHIDPQADFTMVSYNFAELVRFEVMFVRRGDRLVMPGQARISLLGVRPRFWRYVELAALYGPDVVVGRDLLSTSRALIVSDSLVSSVNDMRRPSSPSGSTVSMAESCRKISGFTPLRLAISNGS